MHAYVGDEAIATWRVAKDPTRNARCVACLCNRAYEVGLVGEPTGGRNSTGAPGGEVPLRAGAIAKQGV
jgi:hypothetical protein